MYKYPNYGIGMILTGEEKNHLFNKINEINDLDLKDIKDAADDIITHFVLKLEETSWSSISYIQDDSKTPTDGLSEYQYNDCCIIPAEKTMEPFKAAYKNKQELINEMKNDLDEYMPDNFDYGAHLITYRVIAINNDYCDD